MKEVKVKSHLRNTYRLKKINTNLLVYAIKHNAPNDVHKAIMRGEYKSLKQLKEYLR